MLSLMTTPTDTTPEAWVPSVDTFGSRLALVRHRMNWNVKEAARECGLPAATWRSWEMDGSLPRNIITIAMTIASRTGCDYLWLVHGPERGGAGATRKEGWRRDPLAARIVPRVGDSANGLGDLPQVGITTVRPVRQTRPIAAGRNRLHGAVAV
jgi:hypothetical protein